MTAARDVQFLTIGERMIDINTMVGPFPFDGFTLPTMPAQHALLRGLRLLLVSQPDLDRPCIFPNGEGGYSVEWRTDRADLYVDRRGVWSSWDDPDPAAARDPAGNPVH